MVMLLAVLAVAAAGILGILAIPIDVGINAELAATNKIQVRLGWLFGLVEVNLGGGRPRPRRSPKQRKKHRGRAITFRKVKRVLLAKGLFTAVAQFLRRISGALKVRHFRLHVRFGFDDPADTGMLIAAAAPALWALRNWSEDRFFLEPDFDREVVRADGKVDVRIYPIRIMTASLRFLLSPATLRAALQLL
jgi:hypothetical protein